MEIPTATMEVVPLSRRGPRSSTGTTPLHQDTDCGTNENRTARTLSQARQIAKPETANIARI